MKHFEALIFIAVLLSSVSCNIDDGVEVDPNITTPKSDLGTDLDPKEDEGVPSNNGSNNEEDMSIPDMSNPDMSTIDPRPGEGIVLRSPRMETLNRDLHRNRLTIHGNSIEVNSRICRSNRCITGRILP